MSKREFHFAPEEYLLSNMVAHPSGGSGLVIVKQEELVNRIKADAESIRALIPQIGITGNNAKAFTVCHF